MPISYKDIRNERQWRAATGLNENQFILLSNLLSKKYDFFYGSTLHEQNKERTEKITFRTYEDILFFTLFSLKSDSTYDILSLCFDISRSVAFEKQAAYVRLLQMTLQQNAYMPRREFSGFEDLQKHLDSYDELLIDATEQYRQRAENQELQKSDYSGKKKHTR